MPAGCFIGLLVKLNSPNVAHVHSKHGNEDQVLVRQTTALQSPLANREV
jgi:hypothetical protein